LRRLAVISALLACSLLATAVALGGRPRLEQKRLRAADVALAKRTAVRASDLPAGWVRRAPTNVPEVLPVCPGADLDFSAFTITGKAQSKFERNAAAVESQIEVYESRRDAVGDFRKGSAPAVLACLGPEMRRQARAAGVEIRIESSKLVGRPAVGERAIAYRIRLSVAAGAKRVRLYVDLVALQRGRTIAALFFTGTDPVAGRLAVARAVAARAR